jgi:UDP-N-acetylglucosamine acyltransferase
MYNAAAGMRIHKTAIIDNDVNLADDVEVGAYAVVGPGVVIGPGTVIDPHAVVYRNTRIGAGCHISAFAAVGGDPQDMSYRGEPAFLEIGDRTYIHEYCTLHRGAHGERVTRIGSDCFLMAGVHIAHDCQLGNRVVIANYAQLAGHVRVGDRVTIGGLAAFHQFVRVGTLAMIGGTAGVMQDVPPYCMVQGPPPAKVQGLNLVGLKRNGVDQAGLSALKHAFRLLFRRGMVKDHALDEIERSVQPKTPELAAFVDFCAAHSRRGLCGSENPGSLRIVGGGAAEAGGEDEPGRELRPAQER